MKGLWHLLKNKVARRRDLDNAPEPPWRAKSVAFAALVTAGGAALWHFQGSPALAGIGGSYIGGFFIGWSFRRFVRATILVAGVALLITGTLKATGWIDLDWASIEAWVQQTMQSLQSGAQGLKEVASGYLPSAGAGSAGAFLGFRKKD